ncbi:hypothetical protein [Segetibacter aerophilus]|nr:hypothetical protein [Segetibacter aerophilus]
MKKVKEDTTGKMIHVRLADLNRLIGVSDKNGIKVLMYFVDNYNAMILIPEEMYINVLRDVTERKLAACLKYNGFNGAETIEFLVRFDEERKEEILHAQSYLVTLDDTVDTGVKNEELVEPIEVPEHTDPQKGDGVIPVPVDVLVDMQNGLQYAVELLLTIGEEFYNNNYDGFQYLITIQKKVRLFQDFHMGKGKKDCGVSNEEEVVDKFKDKIFTSKGDINLRTVKQIAFAAGWIDQTYIGVIHLIYMLTVK